MKTKLLAAIFAAAISSPALAQKVDEQLTTDLKSSFSFFEQEAALKISGHATTIDSNHLWLTSCSSPEYIFGWGLGDNSNANRISLIALSIANVKYVLRKSRYPASVWEPFVKEYESTLIANYKNFEPDIEGGDKYTRILAKKLNAYRTQVSGRKPQKVDAGGEGCGAGDVSVKFKSTPPASRVQYINLLLHKLCSKFANADDEKSCDYWEDANLSNRDDAFNLMSGRYKLKVTWPDSSVSYRTLDVDDLKETDSGFIYNINR